MAQDAATLLKPTDTPPKAVPTSAPAPDVSAPSQRVLDAMSGQLQSDQADIAYHQDRADAAFPKLQQSTPPPQQTDPFQAFGQPAMWLAIFGSMLTRQPLTYAVLGAANVLKSTAAMDAANSQRLYDEWKVNAENGLKLAQYEQAALRNAITKYGTDARAGEAMVRTHIAAYKDAALDHVYQTKGMDGVVDFFKARKASNESAASSMADLSQHLDTQTQIVAKLNDPDPNVKADGIDMFAGAFAKAQAGKGSTGEGREKVLALGVKLKSIAARLRNGDLTALQDAAKIEEIGPAILSTAAHGGADFSPPTPIAISDPSTPGGEKQVLAQQDKKTGQWVTADENRTPLDVSGGFRKLAQAETVKPLDADTANYWGSVYNLTGQMPALGLGNSVYRKNILDAAARQAQEAGMGAGDVVGLRSSIHASQQALNVLNRTRANVSNFEKTATKEADLALELATKGGAQGGVPVFNRWIQAGRQEVAGDPDVASFNAALTSFKNEYARIMSAPGATGGVTSDAARAEADSLINRAMTQDMLRQTVNTMKRGMNNRITSIDEEINTTKDRIQSAGKPEKSGDVLTPAQTDGGPPSPPPSLSSIPDLQWSPSRKQFRDPATGKVYDSQGNQVQ